MTLKLTRKRIRNLSTAAVEHRSATEARRLEPRDNGAAPYAAMNLTRLDDVASALEVADAGGKFLLIDRDACQLFPSAEEVAAGYSHYFEGGAVDVSDGSAPIDLLRFVNCGPAKSVFLDIETTSLGRGPLFLVGLLLYRESQSLNGKQHSRP